MRLLKCSQPSLTLEVVELPRQSWRVLPPRRWQIALTLAVIVVTAVVWGVL
jgi:hypothetical protein